MTGIYNTLLHASIHSQCSNVLFSSGINNSTQNKHHSMTAEHSSMLFFCFLRSDEAKRLLA